MAVSNKINILVVDDEATQRVWLKDILKSSGFKSVVDRDSGKAALTWVKEMEEKGEAIDLVISDYDMPGIDGTQLFEHLMENPYTQETKFILISGVADQSFIVQAVKKGIKSILLKPFSKQDLVNELAKLLN